jgi:hypothetical protein
MPSIPTLTQPRSEQASTPTWVKPQLAALVKEARHGPDWLHEIKFDGYRMHAGSTPAAYKFSLAAATRMARSQRKLASTTGLPRSSSLAF